MVIPEFIRLLTAEGISFDEATEIVTEVCAYTNHTILAEALEKWPLAYLEKVVPQLVPIIKKLDEKVRNRYKDESVYIIDKDQRVHMAHIDIHYSHSVNGVAYLHTEILKDSELNNFYKIILRSSTTRQMVSHSEDGFSTATSSLQLISQSSSVTATRRMQRN